MRLHKSMVALLIEILDNTIASLFEEADFKNIFNKVIYNEKSQKLVLSLLTKQEYLNKLAT